MLDISKINSEDDISRINVIRYLLISCYSNPDINCAIAVPRIDFAKSIFHSISENHYSIPEWARPDIDRFSEMRKIVQFHNNSKIHIISSSARIVGLSLNIAAVHSEVKTDKDFMMQLLPRIRGNFSQLLYFS